MMRSIQIKLSTIKITIVKIDLLPRQEKSLCNAL